MAEIDIVIDPGHGGLDNGASYGFVDEDDTNLAISYYLDYELNEAGISHAVTRDRDEDISLEQRSILANIKRPKLFLSIHCDAFHKKTVSGMAVHVHPACSLNALQAAKLFERQLLIHFPDHKYRGIKQSNFHVLRETDCPAVLVECEFLSNPDARKFLKKPENQRRLAQSLKRACASYLGIIS